MAIRPSHTTFSPTGFDAGQTAAGEAQAQFFSFLIAEVGGVKAVRPLCVMNFETISVKIGKGAIVYDVKEWFYDFSLDRFCTAIRRYGPCPSKSSRLSSRIA